MDASREVAGPWRARVATDDLRRDGVGIDVDDTAWPVVRVPGHWRNEPAFADSDGPLLYRCTFDLPHGEPGTRRWVVVDGVFYQADVWFDGAYLGDPEGYFASHAFDVTDLAALTNQHVLAIEVNCPPQRNLADKRSLTGVFQHHEFGRRVENPGGLWRPVRIETTGPVRISRLRVTCRDVGEERAHLRLHAKLDATDQQRVTVRTSVDGVVHAEREHTVAAGNNDVDWTIDVAEPKLWWPWTLGEQAMTDVLVEVIVDGEVSHRCQRRTGLREVALDHWQMSVNGERLFVLGVNIPPTRLDLAEATPEQIRHDVHLAKEAGLNLIRVQGHVGRPELYAAADELGMMVWQDMPLQWGYTRTVRREAVRQATELVDLLGHHPSVVVWCGHNEPIDVRTTRAAAIGTTAARHILAEQRPSWNELLLDPWIKRAIERADETRPVLGYSGAVPRLPKLDGGDSHLWFGWYHGESDDLVGFATAMPRMVQFVSEFGAPSAADPSQAVSGSADRADLAPFERHVPVGQFARPEAWVEATQRYQARLLRRQIETLRRLKYRPTGGLIFSHLFDPIDEIGFGILDVDRREKSAYQAVTDACRRVIVAADLLPETVRPGEALAVDVHVVNDERFALGDARCTAVLSWPGGRHRWEFTGTVEADSVARIGIVRSIVPELPGELWLDLSVVYRGEGADGINADGATSNRYVSRIARG